MEKLYFVPTYQPDHSHVITETMIMANKINEPVDKVNELEALIKKLTPDKD